MECAVEAGPLGSTRRFVGNKETFLFCSFRPSEQEEQANANVARCGGRRRKENKRVTERQGQETEKLPT